MLIWWKIVSALAVLAVLPAQEAMRVSGLVVDENGAPIAGAAIRVIHDADSYLTAELAARSGIASDAAGRFAFPWDAGQYPDALSCTAPGRGAVVVGSAYAALTPIVLPKARRLAGRLRDVDGRPLADVRVELRDWLAQAPFLAGRGAGSFMAPEPSAAVRSDAHGLFVIDSAADTALWLRIGGGGFLRRDHGPLAIGDPMDFVVERTPLVTVVVQNPDGTPVPDILVHTDAEHSVPARGRLAGQTDRNGTFRFGWPARPTSIHVANAAYDRTCHAELRTFQERLVLTLPLPPADAPAPARPDGAVAIRGRVLDPVDARPVAGASVWLCPPGDDREAQFRRWFDWVPADPAVSARTAVDGSFTLYAAPGTHWLGAAERATGTRWHWPGCCRNPLPRPIAVAAGKDLDGIELALQPVVAVPGKVLAEGLPVGCHVRFVPDHERSRSSGEHLAYQGARAIAGDGTFVAADLQLVPHRVQLLVPRLFRQGLPDKVELPVQPVVAGTTLRLDAGACRPATVRGRVHGTAPVARLAVVSLAANDPRETLFGMAFYAGPVAALAHDGAFMLREPAGRRALVVVDLLTGLLLARQPLADVAAGSAREQDLSVGVQRCLVRFADLPPVPTLWLGIERKDGWPVGIGQMTAGAAGDDGGVGCAVPAGTQEIELWLPAGASRLCLRVDRRRPDAPVLAEQQVVVAGGDATTITLRPQ